MCKSTAQPSESSTFELALGKLADTRRSIVRLRSSAGILLELFRTLSHFEYAMWCLGGSSSRSTINVSNDDSDFWLTEFELPFSERQIKSTSNHCLSNPPSLVRIFTVVASIRPNRAKMWPVIETAPFRAITISDYH